MLANEVKAKRAAFFGSRIEVEQGANAVGRLRSPGTSAGLNRKNRCADRPGYSVLISQ
jgi:hypothetical protein